MISWALFIAHWQFTEMTPRDTVQSAGELFNNATTQLLIVFFFYLSPQKSILVMWPKSRSFSHANLFLLEEKD